jgi:hypothetical protein
MKYPSPAFFAFTLIILFTFAASCAHAQEPAAKNPKTQALYNTIVHMDSVYFNAYNSCDMETQGAIYSDTLEFYHDGSGLTNSKTAVLEAIKKNICGKVSRVLVPGTIEVYPLPNFGAVEMGQHYFINHAENNSASKPDKFIMIWRLTNNKWQITRVISLHAGTR